ncbi:MAG: hypothetical protein KAT79_00460 [candidate division Zixibacteria bacterium]|nr:hypothetical protein [candidate division Zixibacteria bacterium]
MRKLIMLVCIVVVSMLLSFSSVATAGVIPSWETPSGQLGFYPIVNEVSLYWNVDDAGDKRGRTLQIISINSFKVWTSFNFEFTGDFNYDLTPDFIGGGFINDHYIELSIVKPVTGIVSLNVQRIISTFETEPVNQFGVRLSF